LIALEELSILIKNRNPIAKTININLSQNLKHIIAACRRKEQKAQKTLYSLFVDRLYFTIFRYVNDPFYAQNILQDVFFKAFKNIDSYDSNKAAFNTWITTIAIRESISHCRKRKIEFSPVEKTKIQYTDNENALSKLKAEDLLKTISEIPDKYRMIFNLYEIDGYSHKEIAEMLGISLGTSRSYLTRAKQQIQMKLAKQYSTQGL